MFLLFPLQRKYRLVTALCQQVFCDVKYFFSINGIEDFNQSKNQVLCKILEFYIWNVNRNANDMILHSSLGTDKIEIQRNLGRLIRSGEITMGGYKKTRIYGTLGCRSGKRMKIENRIFFKDEKQAISEGYRPCAHCMPEKYKLWKLNKDLKIAK